MSKQRTRVSTRQRVDVETRIRQAQLTDLEEQVVRMRHGVAVAPQADLQERNMPHAETRSVVADIERRAVAQLLNGKDVRRKQSIIDQLREL